MAIGSPGSRWRIGHSTVVFARSSHEFPQTATSTGREAKVCRKSMCEIVTECSAVVAFRVLGGEDSHIDLNL